VPTGRLRYGILSGAKGPLDRAVLAVAYDRATGAAVGFNAMSWLDVVVDGEARRVLHAGLCMVAPGFRSRGLSLALSAAPPVLAFARHGLRPLWVTNVTQVPAVAGVFARSLEDVYPAPGRTTPPSRAHVSVAEELLARHRAVFGVGDDAELDSVRFVIRNAYTGGSDDLKKTYAQVTKHRDGSFNALCADLLDYERGDDLLQVGRLTVGFAARVVLRLLASALPWRHRPNRAARRLGWPVLDRTTGVAL
jgi:hypothetical protein